MIEPTDLQRILGYRGAIDERVGLRNVGPEMYAVPMWTPGFCAALIRAAEATGAFAPSADDPVPGHEVSLAVISMGLFNAVQDDIGRRIWPQLRQVWPFIDYYGVRDAFVIKYSEDGQQELRIHHDVAQVSLSVKLNDDYRGATLEFPQQQVTNESCVVGEALAWPSLVTHPHRSTPLLGGTKYSLTIWCEVPSFDG